MTDYTDLLNHMHQNIGYAFDNLKEDGLWHDGGNAPNKGKCRYIVIRHIKGVIVRYHDHRQGESYHTWKSWGTDNTRLSPEEYAQRKAEIDAHNARQQEAAALARAQRIAQQRRVWAESHPANPEHPYLLRKQVGAFGIRQSGNALLIPIRDASGQLQALQYIYPVKREMADGGLSDKQIFGSKRGNFHHIGKPETPTDTVYICEGYATGATIHQITGQCVVIAFDAGNLTPVGQAIRTRYPQAELVFCADNDLGVTAGNIENPGVHYAKQAAIACNGYLITPKTSVKADFNDLMTLPARRHNMTINAKILHMATIEKPTIPTLDLPDDDRAPVQKFDPDLLPESVRGFVIDAADRMQCPIDFLAVTAMVAAGSLVGRKVLMKPKQLDNWTLAPNLWGAVIGRPSAMKSPAISAALQPLRNIEQEMKISHNKEIEQIEIQKAMIEAGAEERKKQMKAAAKNNDVALAAAIMAEGKAPEAPALPRLSVNNSTIEKLGELLAKTNNGLLMERDELAGWLAKLGGKDGGEDRAFYLELYDRLTSYAFDRIMRGTVMIEHPILSIIGGIQPSKIAGVVRGAVSGESDDGLIQRFQLMAYPDNEESFAYRDRVPDPKAYAAYMNVMRGLSELPMPDREPTIWGFTETAQPLFVDWYSDTMTRARSPDMPNALESHMTKMGKPISALALLLELLDGGASGAVGEVATMRALGWAEYLESHANRVYSSGTASATAAAKTILANKSKLPDVFTTRDVWKKGWKGVTQEITEDALDLLIDCNYLMASTTETRANGRPTTRFSWAG